MDGAEPVRSAARREFLLEDPEWAVRRRRQRRFLGWTVAALVGMGALSATVWVATRAYARRVAAEQVLVADLQALARVQTAFFRDEARFGTLEDLGLGYVASQGVRVWVDRADASGWDARATHPRVDVVCRVAAVRGTDPDVRCD